MYFSLFLGGKTLKEVSKAVMGGAGKVAPAVHPCSFWITEPEPPLTVIFKEKSLWPSAFPLLLPLCSESPSLLLFVCVRGGLCTCAHFHNAFLNTLPSEVERGCWKRAARTTVVSTASWKFWVAVHWRGTWRLTLALTEKKKSRCPLSPLLSPAGGCRVPSVSHHGPCPPFHSVSSTVDKTAREIVVFIACHRQPLRRFHVVSSLRG